jgi:hypothetical protein
MKNKFLHHWMVILMATGLMLSGCAMNPVAKSVQSGQQVPKETATKLERLDAIMVFLCGTGGPMPSQRDQAFTMASLAGEGQCDGKGKGVSSS